MEGGRRKGRATRGAAEAAAFAVALAWIAAGVAVGCRVSPADLQQNVSGREVFPDLQPRDTPEDVRAKWGEPQRVFTFRDQVTGREEVVWQYEHGRHGVRGADTVQVVFREGRVARVEPIEERGEPATAPLERPDSAARRDMTP